MNSWLLFDSGAASAAVNMAVDEALLEAMPRLQKPVLRFYNWTEPAASFGYFQKYFEAERTTSLRPLVRRPTGGGIVPHDTGWTYSVAFPARHEWHAFKAVESYRRIHEWLQAAFGRLNVTTGLAPDCRKDAPGQCFAGYEKYDLLWHGKKIAGAAQRRTRDGLLIQGSVQTPAGLSEADWRRAMSTAAFRPGDIEWIEFTMDSILGNRASVLASEKYSQERYNRKR
jgi:lipoate-protein ligase A